MPRIKRTDAQLARHDGVVLTVPDAILLLRVGVVLEWAESLEDQPIVATVRQGCVTLRGNVATRDQRRVAEDVVRHLRGVTEVVNGLTVTAAPALAVVAPRDAAAVAW